MRKFASLCGHYSGRRTHAVWQRFRSSPGDSRSRFFSRAAAAVAAPTAAAPHAGAVHAAALLLPLLPLLVSTFKMVHDVVAMSLLQQLVVVIIIFLVIPRGHQQLQRHATSETKHCWNYATVATIATVATPLTTTFQQMQQFQQLQTTAPCSHINRSENVYQRACNCTICDSRGIRLQQQSQQLGQQMLQYF